MRFAACGWIVVPQVAERRENGVQDCVAIAL
jgi:hypothetical protein